jgi:hypothetical protein
VGRSLAGAPRRELAVDALSLASRAGLAPFVENLGKIDDGEDVGSLLACSECAPGNRSFHRVARIVSEVDPAGLYFNWLSV